MESVTRVRACADYHLELAFDTGEMRVFDARPYLDIAPETLYDRSRTVESMSGR